MRSVATWERPRIVFPSGSTFVPGPGESPESARIWVAKTGESGAVYSFWADPFADPFADPSDSSSEDSFPPARFLTLRARSRKEDIGPLALPRMSLARSVIISLVSCPFLGVSSKAAAAPATAPGDEARQEVSLFLHLLPSTISCLYRRLGPLANGIIPRVAGGLLRPLGGSIRPPFLFVSPGRSH